MPLTPLNNDFLQCPICFNSFTFERKPVTLSCCHTCCSSCLKSLQNCPFDQTSIKHDFPENEAILSLLTINNSNLLNNYLSNVSKSNNEKLTNNFHLSDEDLKHYRTSIDYIQNLAQLIKPQNSSSNLLSRPMQRKLISLLHCQLVDGDARLKAVKFCRSIGERVASELLLKHQDPHTLGTNLWASVRSRGCQFLGPALQEEILKLVLSALEDGSHLSRKVLVMYVVQRLSPHFHQASKTAIGHVIQLLYRASCFRLTKRDGDSSLMQLKEEYSSYEALRREHDTQVVSIALESGLKISPDQWSSFLYGSSNYKSHMQSIIDKLQSPQSFNQSIQELIIALQRTQDPANLIGLKEHLERLAKIESTTETVHTNGTSSPAEETIKENDKDLKESKEVAVSTPTKEPQQPPSYKELAEILESCQMITFRLVDFLKQYNTLFSNVFRFSRSANFNGAKFGKNGKPFNGNTVNKSKSPTNECDVMKVNKEINLFNQLKTVNQSTSHVTLSTNTLVTTESTINTLNHLNKLTKKPCAYVPPTVLQQNGNGTLNSTLNSAIKTNTTTSSFNQANFYSNNKLTTKANTFNGITNGLTNGNITNGISKSNNKINDHNLTNGTLSNGNMINNNNLTNGNLTNGTNRSLSTSSSLTTTSTTTKADYMSNLKMDSKSSFYSITNENQKNNQNIQNNQSTKAQLIKQELLDSHLNHLNQLLQTKQKNGKKSNPNSFSFDDADDQFIPFADDQPKISRFGPISRTMNTNTQTVSSIGRANMKSDLNGSICKNTNVVLGALPSLIRPLLFVSSSETYVQK